MSSFIRKVRTASGATAVQIAHKKGRQIVGIDHIGSAHTREELADLVQQAQEKLNPNQLTLDLEEPIFSEKERKNGTVQSSRAQILWNTLQTAWVALGFDAISDEAFKFLCLARIVEPTSKIDTIRVLEELGVWAPNISTIKRCLKRVVERDYRDLIARQCFVHASNKALTLIMYDVTTLYFEAEKADGLRKPGMSKERRLDPQVVVGLLVDTTGFPLEIHCFEGNRAETLTIIPVIDSFRDRHGIKDIIVVADAAMLSAANLAALEDAGYGFIIASKVNRFTSEIDTEVSQYNDGLQDGQIFETTRKMGRAPHLRQRRVIYQYRVKRARLDLLNIEKQIEKAQKTVAGTRPIKKDRFVSLKGKKTAVNWELIEAAKARAGIKGYVTNLDDIDPLTVIDAYHQLFEVERSFRMAKTDLAARPIYHRMRESIEAHLTIVFAALAVSRYLQDLSGVSIRRIVRVLKPLRTVEVIVGGQEVIGNPIVPDEAGGIIDSITRGGN